MTQRFRQLMSMWPTGVAVVTGFGNGGAPLGFVVGSLCSVSLEPTLVAFCIQKTSSTWQQFRERGRFAINFLAADEGELCARFATGDPTKRFDGLDFDLSDGREPRLRGGCGSLDVTLAQEVDAGDHWLALCQVRHMQPGPSAQPLVFARGHLHRLEPARNAGADHLERWERALDDLQFGT